MVYLHVAPTPIEVADWPLCGTPARDDLDGDDLRKQAALLHAALQWVLQQDIRQEAEREASREISAAADWSKVATEMVQLDSFYTSRPWLKRRTA